MRSIILNLTLLLLTGLATPACLAEQEPQPGGALWMLRAGLEFDDQSGKAFYGGVSYLPDEQTTMMFDFSLSDSAAGLTDLQTRLVSATIDHSFGLVGASLSGGWAGYSDTVNRYYYGGSIYLQTHGLRLGLFGEDWRSNFDTFEFSRLIERPPPLPPLRVTGRADCSLDNTALGLRASWTGLSWSLYAAATDYDYSDADCDFTASIGGSRFRPPPGDLAQDAPLFFNRLSTAVNRIISSYAMFFKRSYSAGVSWNPGLSSLSLDYFHSEEIFQSLRADNLVGSVVFPVGQRTDMELHIGATDYETSGTVGFIGAGFYWYLGGD